jgi:hypothetical protein
MATKEEWDACYDSTHDNTAMVHPAWWRGYNHGTREIRELCHTIGCLELQVREMRELLMGVGLDSPCEYNREWCVSHHYDEPCPIDQIRKYLQDKKV